MHFDPQFVAALLGLIISEIIPIVTKSRLGGIVHSLVALLAKLYSSPGDISGLTAQLAEMQAEIDKLRAPAVPQQPLPAIGSVSAPPAGTAAAPPVQPSVTT